MTFPRWSTARSTPKAWSPTARTSTRSLAVHRQLLPVRITEEELIVYGRRSRSSPGTRYCRARSRANGACTGAPAPGRLEAAGSPVGGTVRRVGRAGPSVPGGPAEGAASRQGPGAAGAGPVGDVRPSGPDRGAGAGRTVRGVPTRPWNASSRPRPVPEPSWRRWPKKNGGRYRPGWVRTWCLPRPTSVYQYLCESEPHDEEKPHTTSGDASSDRAAPAGP